MNRAVGVAVVLAVAPAAVTVGVVWWAALVVRGAVGETYVPR